jgi:hypothetical protein
VSVLVYDWADPDPDPAPRDPDIAFAIVVAEQESSGGALEQALELRTS